MAATLQQTPITFQSRSPPSSQITSKLHIHKPLKFSLSSSFCSVKFAVKLAAKSRSSKRSGGGGAAGARMSDDASESYANALADIAKATGTLEATVADMEQIEKVFKEKVVFNYFIDPTVPIEKKRETVDEIAKGSSLQPHTSNFINILIDMRRIDMILEIAKAFELIYNRLTDTELAVVTSVVKLDSQHLAQIAKGVQKLTGAKNVRIKTAIDPSLVAGFTIRYGETGSKVIDMSVKKQLEDIAEQLEIGDVQLV